MPLTAQAAEALRSADALIHAAYDLSLTSSADIWRVNVEGTRRLLEAAKDAAVDRIIVLSSMSAFEGTTQLYGRAKLDIEAMTTESGGCAVRPGLVYSERAGGMAGAMRKAHHLANRPRHSWRGWRIYGAGTGFHEGHRTAGLGYDPRARNDLRCSSEPGAPNRSDESLCRTRRSPVPVCPRALATDLLAAMERRVYAPAPAVPSRLAARPDTHGPGLAGGEQLARLGVTLHAFTVRGPTVPSGAH